MSHISTSRSFLGSTPSGQTGAVLIVALIMLVVLTLLGVSAMNTTQLEERMASNQQERQRAFQTAENGLSVAFNDDDAWSLNGATGATVTTPGSVSGLKSDWESTFLGFSAPPTNLGYDTTYQAAHFNFQSTGTREGIVGAGSGGATDLVIVVNGGGFQIAPNLTDN